MRSDHSESRCNTCCSHIKWWNSLLKMPMICAADTLFIRNWYTLYIDSVSFSIGWSLDSQPPQSITKRVFWELKTDFILSAVLCPWSPWSEEISSIARLFSLHQYSNMPWINTGSTRGSPVGVTLKGLTLWLPSWCEGLKRLPTSNIWTSRTPPHHTSLLNTSSYTQAHTHSSPIHPHTLISFTPTYTHIATAAD